MNRFPLEIVSLEDCKQSRAKGFSLANGEYLLRCLYDKSHVVRNTILSAHLEKCRRNFELKYEKRGMQPFKLSCAYNPQHLVHAPELYYHEYNCKDQHVSVLKQVLQTLDWEEIGNIFQGKFEKPHHQGKGAVASSTGAKLRPIQMAVENKPNGDLDMSLSEVQELIKIQQLTSNYGIDISQVARDIVDRKLKKPEEPELGNVEWGDPEILLEMGYREHNPSRLSQMDHPTFHRRRILTRRHYPRKQKEELWEEVHYDSDSEEYWVGDTTRRPKFDWFENQRKPAQLNDLPKPYPQGLTKSERKQFEVWNSERLMTMFGIVFEENPNKF